MTIEAVIFDMEGVLTHSEPYWFKARQKFASRRDRTWTMEDQRLAMGRNTLEWAQVMKDRLDVAMPVETIAEETKALVIEQMEARLPVLPGAQQAVQEAANRYQVALASGSPTEIINRVLQLMQLQDVFEVVIYGDEVARGKPAPDIYRDALRQLGVEASQAVALEDSANGIRSAHAAGLQVIAVSNPEIPLPDDVRAMTVKVIDSLHEFSAERVAELG